jgi:hypothetical protein
MSSSGAPITIKLLLMATDVPKLSFDEALEIAKQKL